MKQQSAPDVVRTINPLAALKDADGEFTTRPISEFKIICLPGHSPVALLQYWEVRRESSVHPDTLQQLVAAGDITEQEADNYNRQQQQTGGLRAASARA